MALHHGFLFLFVCLSLPALHGLNVYVSSTGHDSANGLSLLTAVRSLTRAMELASASPSPHIWMAGNFTSALDRDITIPPNSFIHGNHSTINCGGAYRAFLVTSGGGYQVDNLDISNCRWTSTTSRGGAIFVGGPIGQQITLELSRVSLRSNAAFIGGALFVSGDSTVVLKQCTLCANSAASSGGAVGISGGKLVMEGGLAEGNSAGGSGGMLWTSLGNVTLSAVTATGNRAFQSALISAFTSSLYWEGGAFSRNIASEDYAIGTWFNSVEVRLRGTAVSDNHAVGDDNILKIEGNGRPLSIQDCVFVGNSANDKNGGIYLSAISGGVVNNVTFRDNAAGSYAGLYLADSADILFSRLRVLGNRASKHGGGVFGKRCKRLRFVNCSVEGNRAPVGGGVSWEKSKDIVFEHSRVLRNVASKGGSGDGGGVLVGKSSAMAMARCEVAGNTAGGNGGGIAVVAKSSIQLTGCTVSDNVASGSGGGAATTGDLTDHGSVWSGNSGSSGGGIVADGSAALALTSSAFNANSALDGGALSLTESSTAAFSAVTMTGNSASAGGGGAVLVSPSAHPSFSPSGLSFSANAAAYGADVGGSLSSLALHSPPTTATAVGSGSSGSSVVQVSAKSLQHVLVGVTVRDAFGSTASALTRGGAAAVVASTAVAASSPAADIVHSVLPSAALGSDGSATLDVAVAAHIGSYATVEVTVVVGATLLRGAVNITVTGCAESEKLVWYPPGSNTFRVCEARDADDLCTANDYSHNVTACDGATASRQLLFQWKHPRTCWKGVALPPTTTLPCDYIPAASPAASTLSALAVATAVIAVACLALVVLQWHRGAMRMVWASPLLYSLFAAGCAIAPLSAFSLIGVPTAASCTSRALLLILGLFVGYSGLFLVVYRWYQTSRKHLTLLSDKRLLLKLSLVLLPVTIFLAVWLVVAPPAPTVLTLASPVSATASATVPYAACVSPGPLPIVVMGFWGIWLLLGFVLSLRVVLLPRWDIRGVGLASISLSLAPALSLLLASLSPAPALPSLQQQGLVVTLAPALALLLVFLFKLCGGGGATAVLHDELRAANKDQGGSSVAESSAVDGFHVSLRRCLRNPVTRACLRQIMAEQLMEESILFWTDAYKFRKWFSSPQGRATGPEEKKARAQAVYAKYLAPDAPLLLNMDAKCRALVDDHLAMDDIGKNVFDPPMAVAYSLMKSNIHAQFLRSDYAAQADTILRWMEPFVSFDYAMKCAVTQELEKEVAGNSAATPSKNPVALAFAAP